MSALGRKRPLRTYVAFAPKSGHSDTRSSKANVRGLWPSVQLESTPECPRLLTDVIVALVFPSSEFVAASATLTVVCHRG